MNYVGCYGYMELVLCSRFSIITVSVLSGYYFRREFRYGSVINTSVEDEWLRIPGIAVTQLCALSLSKQSCSIGH